MPEWEQQFESKLGPSDREIAWSVGKDVGWANLWSCAGVVVSKKVQDDDGKCGEEQWEVSHSHTVECKPCCDKEVCIALDMGLGMGHFVPLGTILCPQAQANVFN